MIEIIEIKNIDSLLQWRKEVIENVFGVVPSVELMESNERYYRRNVAAGLHLAFEAIFMGQQAGCGAVCFSEELPSPDNPSGRCAYLMNIYVRNRYRDHGIAHAIVSRLIAEAHERNCGKIYLETTPEGRHVYESLGFHDLPDMMKLNPA